MPFYAAKTLSMQSRSQLPQLKHRKGDTPLICYLMNTSCKAWYELTLNCTGFCFDEDRENGEETALYVLIETGKLRRFNTSKKTRQTGCRAKKTSLLNLIALLAIRGTLGEILLSAKMRPNRRHRRHDDQKIEPPYQRCQSPDFPFHSH